MAACRARATSLSNELRHMSRPDRQAHRHWGVTSTGVRFTTIGRRERRNIRRSRIRAGTVPSCDSPIPNGERSIGRSSSSTRWRLAGPLSLSGSVISSLLTQPRFWEWTSVALRYAARTVVRQTGNAGASLRPCGALLHVNADRPRRDDENATKTARAATREEQPPTVWTGSLKK